MHFLRTDRAKSSLTTGSETGRPSTRTVSPRVRIGRPTGMFGSFRRFLALLGGAVLFLGASLPSFAQGSDDPASPQGAHLEHSSGYHLEVESPGSVPTLQATVAQELDPQTRISALALQADKARLTDRDLVGFSARHLTLARNAIYAIHGRTFSDPELSAYFMRQSWYNPDPYFHDGLLSELERTNAQFIQNYQRRNGLEW